jgi:hypothetical protein
MHGGGTGAGDATGAADEVTDSIRMFRSGIAGGKPAPGRVGVAPEWFYKGDGIALVAPEQPLPLPGFAGDGGEEAELPATVDIEVRLARDGAVIWSQRFKTGEANMTHSLANMEHHHFKYPAFRRPGDLHCHFLGTAALSFAAGIAAQTGDRFEIESATFGRPLRNELGPREEDRLISVTPL